MIGETVSHYKIVEKLGEGGMGVVYKAEDIKLKRPVALKFLPSRITSSGEDLARLTQEAQAAAILNHPNICTIYAIEEVNERRFISMEYMNGITLRKKIADAPMKINDVISYAIQIGEALQEAHNNGVVHRDIKTENIMINSKNQVKVMDFGLAKLKGSSADQGNESTYGTAAYMSPEQAMGRPASFYSDIWSFGVVCYEMLTGKLPFIHNYEAAIIYSILNEEPIPPSKIRPDISHDLEIIILTCLQKEEEKRYQNAEQIIHELHNIKKHIESKNIREKYDREQIKGVKKATEQKQATIVYMQIQDYTGLMDKVGKENIVGILEKYYDIINRVTQKYGGTVNKTKASEAVLYFGLPETIENASQKALNAAVEIRSEFSYLYKENKISQKFSLNIAISSGIVIAGSITSGQNLEYTVIGDPVEIASRVLEMAADGQILVGSLTFRYLKNMFNFKYYKSLSLKGKRDPVKIYEFEQSGIKPDKDLILSKRLIQSEMVGRNEELDKLEYLLLKTINGDGSVVSIIAEAGIGKSRLINEFKNKEIFKRVVTWEGKAESTGKNVSFHPVIDIVKKWARINDNDNESQAFSKLEITLLNLFGEEADEIIPFIATIMGYRLTGDYEKRVNEVSSDALSKLIQKSMRQLVLKITELNPLVIIIEDLHWADLSSIELLNSLFRLAEKNKLLFINTMRPNFFETGERALSVLRDKYSVFHTEVNLNPLNIYDRQILIKNLLKMQELPPQIGEAIITSTEGNPFFIEEVIRSLIDDNIIEVKNDRFIISQDIKNIVIPGTVKDVLLARIDKLDESTKYVLKIASVIGRYFLYDILKKVINEYGDPDAYTGYLIKLELIKENKNSDDREYMFQHALAQEAVYETLLTKNKQELHLKVAKAIEDLYAGRIDDFYELLAHHYSLADHKEKAEEYLIKAGERTLKNSASNEALNYFRKALELYISKYGDKADKEKLFMFEKNIGISFYNKGYFMDAVEHFNKALQAAGIKIKKSCYSEWLRLSINFILIIYHLYSPFKHTKKSPTEKDIELFDIQFKIANAYANYNGKKMFSDLLNLIRVKMKFALDSEDGFTTYSWASSLFSYSGISFPLSRRFIQKANSIARSNGIDEVYNMGYDETIFICLSGNWKSFSNINEKLLDIKLRAGDLYYAIYQISWALYITISRGNYEYAEYLIEKGDEISETYDFDYGKLFMLSSRADLYLNQRKLQKAIAYYNEACISAYKMGLTSWIVGLSGKRAKAFILLNDLNKAKDSLNKAETAVKNSGSLTPLLLYYYQAYTMYYYIMVHEIGIKEALPEARMKIIEREIKKCLKKVVKGSNKVADIKPEINRYIGRYYHHKHEYFKAVKYLNRSIEYSKHLGALPELARGYLELGTVLSQSKIDSSDSMIEIYFNKSRDIFTKLNLNWDLDEMNRIENHYTSKID